MKPVPGVRVGFNAIFAIVCVAVIAYEGAVLFLERDATFRIEGKRTYDVTEFASGSTVRHAFLMRGDGLRSVRVNFSSAEPRSVKVQWTLWRGFPDEPKDMTRAFEGVESLDLRPGHQWKTFNFTRDGSSNERWYTIEMRLLDPPPAPFPLVSILASSDNPERGGVLFVDDVRQPGSLYLRADRRGGTFYRRFVAEAGPNLPAMLRIPAVQWAVVVTVHWALMVFAYALLADATRVTARGPS